MKPEVSERLLIEELFSRSCEDNNWRRPIINVDRLTGDASTRRYYRLESTDKTYVVCLDNPTEKKNRFVEVQSFLKEHKISVPEIYHMDLTKGYILEEDLGDKTLLSLLSQIDSKDEEFNVYQQSIMKLLDIHNIPRDKIEASKKFPDAFDYEKLMQEIRFTFKYFIEIYLGIKDSDYLEILEAEFNKLCQEIASKKMVLTHRDFHSRNIMVKQNDLRIIDFQDARWGIPQYDLVSLLEDCYYQIDQDNKERLKEFYFTEAKISDQNREEFESLYTATAIQRVFKAIGSFTYIFNYRQDERYLKYIGYAMENLRRLMFSDKKYKKLRLALCERYYES